MSLTQIKEPSVIAKLKAQASMSPDAEQILNYIRAIEKANTLLQDNVRGARAAGVNDFWIKLVAVLRVTVRNIEYVPLIRCLQEKGILDKDEQPVHNPPARTAGASV